MQKTKNLLRLLLILVITIIALFSTVTIYRKTRERVEAKKILPVGLTKGQEEYFTKELSKVGRQFGYIKKGDKYLDNNDIESAIQMYEVALKNAYSNATESQACRHLANAYEKKHDYKKALEYIALVRDKYVNDWAKEPVAERAKYLGYASKGEYELAVEHARKAMQAEMKIHDLTKPRKDYQDRLNDLIAAKGYVLSLKKE